MFFISYPAHGKIGEVTRQKIFIKLKALFLKLPPKVWIIGGVLFLAVLYSIVFFIPKNVQFSYAQSTCIGHFALAPDLQQGKAAKFDVKFENVIRLGSVGLFSTQLCLEPNQAPVAGASAVQFSPWGGWVFRKNIAVQVPDAPQARTSDLIGKTISATQPLKLSLSSPDVIHAYAIKVGDKTGPCTQNSDGLTCDVKPLALNHGAEYVAALYRSYKGSDNSKIIEGKLATLQPLLPVNSSITNDQTVYDKPTTAQFTFDQTIKKNEVRLVKVNGEATEPIEIKTTTKDAVLTVTFPELARESTYRFELADVVGVSGSSLATPIAVNFKTSGGPKVAGVSIGTSGVSRTAKVVVTFDQPIDASVDIKKFARVEGVAASVSKQSDTQVAFALNGGDCAAFTLVVDKGIKSASNGLESKEAWRYSSRMTCGTSWVIGTSVQGRAITAYSFGSGAKVLLFTAGIHGSEPSSTTTMQAWVVYLRSNGYKIPADKRIVVVPNTNPDGIARGMRYNANNVNLGRNFPTANWSASIDTSSGTLPQGGGTSPGSEPEAAALIRLTRQLRPRLEVSYHAQGSLVGANKYGDSVAIGNIYAGTVRYGTMYYNAEDVMGYAMTGEYEDWMGEEMGIPAILIELPRQSGNYFNSQLPALLKLLAL